MEQFVGVKHGYSILERDDDTLIETIYTDDFHSDRMSCLEVLCPSPSLPGLIRWMQPDMQSLGSDRLSSTFIS